MGAIALVAVAPTIACGNFEKMEALRTPTPPAMTEIHNLGITDTEYAQLIAQGYDPNLERQLIELGESLDQARKLARIVGLTKDKPPVTDLEWEELMEVLEDGCKLEGNEGD